MKYYEAKDIMFKTCTIILFLGNILIDSNSFPSTLAQRRKALLLDHAQNCNFTTENMCQSYSS